MMIHFRYIAQPRGYGKPTAHAHEMMFDALPVRSNGMPSKKIMESLRMFVFVETVLRRGRMFQGRNGV